MRSYYFYVGLFLLVLSVGTCILSYQLGLGDMHNPGPGFLPFGVATILGLMSIGLSLRSLFEVVQESQKREVFKGIEWRKVILVFGVLLGYGIGFNLLGFRICAFLLMILLLRVVGRRKWWLSLIISFFTVLFAYLIFVVWLGSPFPTGPFGI